MSLRLANIYGPRNLSGPLPTFFQPPQPRASPASWSTPGATSSTSTTCSTWHWRRSAGTGEGHYHVSSGSDYSIKELFDAVVSAMGIELEEDVEVRPRPPDDAPSILLDPARTEARTSAGRPRPRSTTASSSAVEWYRENGVGETYTHLKAEEVKVQAT